MKFSHKHRRGTRTSDCTRGWPSGVLSLSLSLSFFFLLFLPLFFFLSSSSVTSPTLVSYSLPPLFSSTCSNQLQGSLVLQDRAHIRCGPDAVVSLFSLSFSSYSTSVTSPFLSTRLQTNRLSHVSYIYTWLHGNRWMRRDLFFLFSFSLFFFPPVISAN